MSQWNFDAPGWLQDFSDPAVWHSAMESEAQGIVVDLVRSVLGRAPVTEAEVAAIAPLLAYANPALSPPPAEAQTVAIAPWGAFPKAVDREAPYDLPDDPVDPDGSLRAAEHRGSEDLGNRQLQDRNGNPLDLPVRDRQDEYCEWAVRRNSEGKMTKAIFVAEGYDYFDALFSHDERAVVDLYREFTENASLTADDLRAPEGVYLPGIPSDRTMLVRPGGFNWRNRHNIDPGIVHLSHRANSLGAEINLAGVSGLARRTVGGETLQPGDPERLLCCSRGGDPNRNSDPLIGDQAYAQVIAKRRFTLANPVGLYIASIEERLTLPSGEPVPREWWRVVRGRDLWDPNKSRVLRLELDVPAGENLVLGDLMVEGEPLLYGGQLARLLAIHLFVTVWPRDDDGIGPIVPCNGTCCRIDGTEILVPTNSGSCGSGSTLAFEDLVPAPSAELFSASSEATLSAPSPSPLRSRI
ncbi:MAG TPA: hypothetical protein VFR28_05555 [Allosphingosinicella sp.]|nr:hypothetical protein [Allosphingosinicella sp.]